MKSYNDDLDWAKSTVEITLQSEEYKGKYQIECCGNVRGVASLLNTLDINLYDENTIKSSDCNMNILFDEEDECWFICVLKDKKGNTLNIEQPITFLDRYIVKAEIVKYEEYKD